MQHFIVKFKNTIELFYVDKETIYCGNIVYIDNTSNPQYYYVTFERNYSIEKSLIDMINQYLLRICSKENVTYIMLEIPKEIIKFNIDKCNCLDN